MREAVGEANMVTITIALVAIVITGGVEIVRMTINNIRNNNYSACTNIGYTYNPSNDNCTNVSGDEIDVPR